MIHVRTMGDVWREKRLGIPKAKYLFTASDVLAQRLNILNSDIEDIQSAVIEGLPGAIAMMAKLRQQLRTLKGA